MTNLQNLSKTGLNQLKEVLIDTLKERNGINLQDLHNIAFNEDYFIIGYFKAEKWLSDNYGIFQAMRTIQEYENSNFGAVNTDLSNSETVVNMLVYILGEELISLIDTYQEYNDQELTPKIAKILIREIKNKTV